MTTDETAALVPAPPSATVPTDTLPSSDYYQIDYSVQNSGRVFQPSKKRVTWSFGNRALNDATYQVVLVWSKRTGKQCIEMDGVEEYNSRQKGASIVTHQWTTSEDMALHVLASRVSVKSIDNLRKYELMINGIPFSSLPLQDGTPPPDVTSIVEILYPDGYDPNKFKDDPLPPLSSAVDEYEANTSLADEVTARRPVRSDGTAR